MLRFIPEDSLRTHGGIRDGRGRGATDNFPFQARVAALGSDVPPVYRQKGGNPAMNTQIGNTSGFANNFWVQMAVLVIAVGGLIAIAAKYIW
jgi:hypothetical protein